MPDTAAGNVETSDHVAVGTNIQQVDTLPATLLAILVELSRDVGEVKAMLDVMRLMLDKIEISLYGNGKIGLVKRVSDLEGAVTAVSKRSKKEAGTF